ncbi:MAG TPA: serine/threonine protein kinase [Gammaproteobacteria bacterium]|nr:serine/threonine protein kinase [Gammaproteobacteria bacterium]
MSGLQRIPLTRGYLLDCYRIERVISSGGFSLIYLASDINTQDKVVLKEYYPDKITQRVPGGRLQAVSEQTKPTYILGLQQFLAEAAALAGIKHPNIVNVFNFFRCNSSAYLAMEHVEGRNLRWLVKQHHGRIPQPALVKVVPAVLSGLRALHGSRFLHLDIKPANILLRSSGPPLLVDFGAVQYYEPGKHFAGIQTITSGYSAPEQYQQGEMGPWTDLYAIGATLYACITGEAPPDARQRLQKDTLPMIQGRLSRQYSPHLLSGIYQSLLLDCHSRPATVDAFMRTTFRDFLPGLMDEE